MRAIKRQLSLPSTLFNTNRSSRLLRFIRTQAQYEYTPREDYDLSEFSQPAGLATPRQLAQYLDEYVVGQQEAKKVLSVAVFNHYNRVRANMQVLEVEEDEAEWSEEPQADAGRTGVVPVHLNPHPRRSHHLQGASLPTQLRYSTPTFEKSNVLVLGPTGSGKTLLARTLAKVLDVPFSVSDATSFTQAGYVGEDVDMCIHRLLQTANWDPFRASTGIVYIDEVDKIARKSSGGGIEGSRDVGGEGVQQALLRMMEGSIVTVPAKGTSVDGQGSPPSEGRSRAGQRNANLGPPKPDMYQIDTSNVLFILSGAFVGLDNIIKRRVAKGSIGFTADLGSNDDTPTSDFMPFFTSNRRPLLNMLEHVEPADLVKYGFIPEFISRLPSVATLAPLTPTDLRRILTEVRGCLVSQYIALFGYSGAEIRFTSGALDEICHKAAQRGGGARGLRGIMENLLLEPMYEVPGSNIRHVLIDKTVVRGERPALYWSKGEGAAFWTAWTEAEAHEEQST
ncbi:P-loop containing nucleoside triphosphate hydrolase protein [Multifurca ochricompacta]|uniref:P-loop containing nucleoside triphosphate hydrolase protein n=1 Tax=Multifurca ochricompacta TaxID=376703 RepID=A0AAD4QQQ6_9AGAM|nr:P-loop containing nucleoside triphosphate hydrolase protein [Multifurca ochricompacta]